VEVASLAGPSIFGIPVVFSILGAALVGIMLVHGRALEIALTGLVAILVLRGGFSSFDLVAHFAREWSGLVNLVGLIVGFALLADHLERSRLPELLPRVLSRGALGCFQLLFLVWTLSGVVDNIAAAIVGATLASSLFDRRVHLGFLAAIVAAANAGGAGSVLGDTTTTMIWIDGASPLAVLPAYVGSAAALVVFGAIASLQQARYAPVRPPSSGTVTVDLPRLVVVAVTLAAAVAVNVAANRFAPEHVRHLPILSATVWLGLTAGALVRPPRWSLVPRALKSSLFLAALVASASLMPVETLPVATWRLTLALGFVSAIFDNIPLTKLALEQGGHAPALLAYSLGVGGSMMWFGSSAGVAVAAQFPEARSAAAWLRHAWHVPLAFVIGFFAMLI
jgi:Na+/H+ antiporter NhaD/arsenite permease-like protein